MTASTTRNPLRRLYVWVLSWSDHPMGTWALALISFVESIFFPIPPDVLLIGLCLGDRSKWARYAAVCSAASVAGGIAGYAIGYTLLEPVCLPLIGALGLHEQFARASLWYREYDVWAVGAAGFSPIPYKVFTLSAGMTRLDFVPFVLASGVSRAARFFLVGWMLHRFGVPARRFIDRHLNRLALAFVVLLAGGFVVIGLVTGSGQPEVDLDRAEGLIAELEVDEPEARAEAILELRLSTGHYEAYDPDGPAEERQRAVERWRAWLAAERSARP